MRSNIFKAILGKSGIAASVLLLASGAALGQQQINLTAAGTTATLPDGSAVPMWGYSCGAAVGGSSATCAKLNPTATGWSPIVITVPTTATGGLTINLTNNLPGVPTSLTIVGQLGGGLGSAATSTPSPNHAAQGVTWPAADPTTVNNPVGQGSRVQSFSMEVAAGATSLLPAWANLRPGTYLIESGTHPSIQGPMGLYGILVVTTAPAGATAGEAYPAAGTNPAVAYNAEIPLLFSEIDPVQNAAVALAVTLPGFSETTVWSGQPGGCGNPATTNSGNCYPPAVNYRPLYYLINGAAFDKTKSAASLFPAVPGTAALPVTGTVLVRMVNAGLRMHVPSIVGSQTGSAAPGMGLIAEDGNHLPGVTRVQNEVFLAAGKTYDVTINVPAAGTVLPIFDREGSLSGNATSRDAGMLAYISVNGAAAPSATGLGAGVANADTYNAVVSGKTLTVSDTGKGLIANDVNIFGVKVVGAAPAGLVLNSNGTFTYTGPATSFTYCGNGATSGPACNTVTLGAAPIEAASGITVGNDAYTSTVATSLTIKTPGILSNDKDAAGYPLTAEIVAASGATVSLNADGSFTATVAAHAGPATASFTYKARNSQGTPSSSTGTVSLTFPAPSGLQVTLIDGVSKQPLPAPADYRWIIEEDRTFFIDPKCQTNPLPVGCPVATPQGTPAIFGTNFHTAYMPVVAQGCVGTISCESGQSVLGASAVCDIGNGVCHPGATKTPVNPSDVVLDPTKHYYISVLPGDAMDPGHAMGGAQLAATCTPAAGGTCTPTFGSVNIIVEPESQPAAQVSAFVFEDDHPLNGEHDASGGVDTLSPNEPGLGGFNITIIDLVGMSGDSAGQLTYDEFGQPLSNGLAGTKDPTNGNDACPISKDPTTGFDGTPSPTGITGMIPVCPKYESDHTTLSPLAGQAIVKNLPPGRYGIIATPAADRIARGEEWLQTNTLDGGKDHEAFIKVNEPSYFQEFGPASYHVSIGFANPKLITDEGTALCTATIGGCPQTVKGMVTGARMSRPSDERLYGSGSRDTFGYTQCYASLGSPDGADIAFGKCDENGNFVLTGIPAGDWRLTIFDQWNDQIVDGITTPVRVGGSTNATLCHGPTSNGTTCDMGEIGVHGWKNNLSTRTFIDGNGDGVSQDDEPGLAFVPTNIRYRDGSISNLNSTDLDGFAGFNEVFPIFNWYVMETDFLRYKSTGTHVINDAGGPVDGSTGPYACGQPGYPICGTGTSMLNMARTSEDFPLPSNLRVPGARYCANADCPAGDTAGGSTGRVDPPWVTSYGWQSYMGQNQLLEFGKKPFADGENGGIRGHVVYASTRPFDDPALLLQLTWEPQVPNVTINLYKEGFADDHVTPTLTLVDTTKTSSWDDWAQGFRSDGVPNMNCPGQSTGDLFFYTMQNQPNYLDWYNSQHGGPAATPLLYGSQYKCYDGMHNWNQLQPAPYDGMYKFPSITSIDPATGKPAGTNCTGCVLNTAAAPTDWDYNLPMLPAGKYVVEMVVPPGYELVKEEDKNILLGDTYEAPVTSQFAGFGNVFIMPDQASIAAYNANNSLNMTTDLGAVPRHEGDTGSVEVFWPCVGVKRVVPDFNSLFPLAGQNAPFAGATRPLCDRKEVVLEDQMSVLAKFYVFSSTHIASHFTGIISDDFTSEFDPFSPAFGEKFSPPNLPVGIKDWAGNEIGRVYSDQHGIYNGLTFSTFAVNPPDPSGYIPNMLDMCMNDRGSGVDPDPFYQKAYSQFCYEWSFMPGQTSYLDTPVIPTAAFAAEYNHPDCDYPDATPAVKEVDGDGVGPWVAATGTGHPITIKALGDQAVSNYAYSGPSSQTAPYNAKTITRHYGFGATQGTGSVTIGGVTAAVTSWSDTQIVVSLPASPQVPSCTIQQRGVGGARCGELVITAGNGKRSVDTVTVTVGGKAPTVMTAGQTIQSAIDQATAGDLIIVPAGTYHEMLLMWKPVRLQGVGAASSIIDASTHPSGMLLNAWRQRVVCLFGLGLDGLHGSWDNSCGTGLVGFNATASNPQVDRLPLEATVGWDATLNGNLAEQLQEPTLMGAYEGAGITVLSKGVRFPNNNSEFAADTFPDGTTLLTSNNANNNNCNAFPSDFWCNPSRIDGLSVTNSSQGGGGIYVHGWAHSLEISNNRVNNNQGTLAGGITVGQGEHPDGYIQGDAAGIPAPGSCQNGGAAGTQLPYCFDLNVNVHHNAVTANSSEGDELFSATPSGAGGVAFCTGADFYKFNFNWVCGNLSTGDGAGVAQLGFVYHSNNDSSRGIQHNTILFNQATNPTTPANGGGLLIMSAPDTDPTCPGEADADCPHAFGTVGDGIGPNLLINANLIMGNAAEAGSGGGIRFQGVNGSEVSAFNRTNSRWYSVDVTNNIITNNVAGWDGAGVSLQDSLVVNLINNTIASNDATATSGSLFGAFFAPEASAPTPCPRDAGGANIRCVPLSAPQPAGVSSARHTAEFLASLPGTITCPTGHGAGNNGACRSISFPILYNDVIWQNRAFNVVVTQPGAGGLQSTVALVPTLNQAATGQCVSAGANYWDIGLRGDTGPTNHGSGFTFAPQASILTNVTGYAGGGSGFRANTASNPALALQYCNGSKVPPEAGASVWYQVPPGTNESNVPIPIFSLTAGATVDEGNNWINISWGPLSLIKPSSETNPSAEAVLSNYALSAGSPAIGYITNANSGTTYQAAPATDFFENPRKTNNAVDVGAVEFTGPAGPAVASVTPTSLAFGNVATGSTSAAQTVTLQNTGGSTLTGIGLTFSSPRYSRAGGTCTTTLASASSCTITVVFAPTATGSVPATLSIAASVPVTGSPVALSGTGVVPATVSVTPNPLTITVATPNGNGGTGTGTVTFRNTAAAGGASVTVSSVAVNSGAGSNILTWFFNAVAGADNCTGTTLAPGAACTVGVRFTNVLAATGVNHPGTIVFTDNGAASPQTGTLTGHANP